MSQVLFNIVAAMSYRAAKSGIAAEAQKKVTYLVLYNNKFIVS